LVYACSYKHEKEIEAMDQRKIWCDPSVEELDMRKTQWTTLKGTEEDEYQFNCAPLYFS